jgi:polysaccharide deacetylase 2 family uncharacterized protein YibQ
MIRRVIILAALAAGAWYAFTRSKPARELKSVCAELQQVVNQELTRAGLTDKDRLRDLHTAKNVFGLVWIESDRQFRLDLAKAPAIIDRLEKAAGKLGCKVLKRQKSASSASLEIGKWFFHLERIEFVPLTVQPKALATPEVALVIDDVAYDMQAMDHFAALNIPLTFAILPRARYTRELSNKAVSLKFPVIIHMPMEPLDMVHNNPGSSALYLKMTPQELRMQFEKNLASVPNIVGLNNHMGSAFTEDVAKMKLVLGWLKEKHLFFLDSNTSPKSVGRVAAKAIGIPCLINETFLDNADDVKAIEKQLDIVMKLALQRKRTIAIGHYRRKYLVEAIKNKLPEFRSKGITFVGLPAFYPPS